MAGMQGGLGFSPTRRASTRWSACRKDWRNSSKPHGIGVSVLCPHFVRTRIRESGRNRPERYGETQTFDPASPAGQMLALIAASVAAGLDPAEVAVRVLAAIREDELYVFTHPEFRGEVDARFAAIQAAMDRAAPAK